MAEIGLYDGSQDIGSHLYTHTRVSMTVEEATQWLIKKHAEALDREETLVKFVDSSIKEMNFKIVMLNKKIDDLSAKRR